MKKIAILFIVLIALSIALFGVYRVYNENKKITFDEMDLRKIAWDSLSEGEKKSIVKDEGELKVVLAGEKEINIETTDVWKYASVEVAKYKNIGTLNLIKMNSSGQGTKVDIITKFKNWYKQNFKVIRVSFKTTMDGLLGPITLYIDPTTKKVLGSDLRF